MTRQDVRSLGAGRVALWCGVVGACLLAAIALGVSFGAGKVTLVQLLPWGPPASDVDLDILLRVRLPRVLLAAILGGALSVAGVCFQALLRNPLADPYVLGVSGGASIGGVLALVLGASSGMLRDLGVPLMAFAGALGALLLIEWVATVDRRLTVYNVLLTGAIFNAFSSALIYFVQSLATLEELRDIVVYLMGRFPVWELERVAPVALICVPVLIALYAMSRDFNAFSLGEEAAQQLGVDVERVKRRTFILASLLTGLAVSVAGLIGFVGLIIPHVLRMLLGPDHRILLPTAFLGGGAFLVLSDLAARLLIAPGELPVGVVTALIGGPFFLYLLRTHRRRYGF
ncbi:MAG: iron ABC transporter permease [Planctomycetota bacterium]